MFATFVHLWQLMCAPIALVHPTTRSRMVIISRGRHVCLRSVTTSWHIRTCGSPLLSLSTAKVCFLRVSACAAHVRQHGGRALGDAFATLEGVRERVLRHKWPAERQLDVAEFLRRLRESPPVGRAVVLDVRSSLEYARGHLPGALPLPLLSDAERAAVGSLHKSAGQMEAFDLALGHVYPKLAGLLTQVRTRVEGIETGSILLVYCKRGGLRSQSVASFLSHHGFDVYTLSGGCTCDGIVAWPDAGALKAGEHSPCRDAPCWML